MNYQVFAQAHHPWWAMGLALFMVVFTPLMAHTLAKAMVAHLARAWDARKRQARTLHRLNATVGTGYMRQRPHA
jgi:multisubunit Na+/H+ antiporter MnhG subunit